VGPHHHRNRLDRRLVLLRLARQQPDAAQEQGDADKGVGGEQWGVHGGGFYHHQKYPVSPGYVPDQLHWSMWESYSTWLSGFALFTVLYLYNASTFLIDKTLFDWSPAAAVSTALAFFVAFWVLYDLICRTLGRGKNGDQIVGACVFVLIVFASWLSAICSRAVQRFCWSARWWPPP
jgi:uncharacterized membrane protein